MHDRRVSCVPFIEKFTAQFAICLPLWPKKGNICVLSMIFEFSRNFHESFGCHMMRASNFLRLRETVENKYNVTHSTRYSSYYLCVWKMKLQLITVQVPPSLMTQDRKPLSSCYHVKKVLECMQKATQRRKKQFSLTVVAKRQ